MEVNPKDPKTIGAAVVILAGTLAGGSLLGFTVEPQSTTDLRVENATLRERATNLEGQVEDLEGRVEALEDIVAECRRVLTAPRPSTGG